MRVIEVDGEARSGLERVEDILSGCGAMIWDGIVPPHEACGRRV